MPEYQNQESGPRYYLGYNDEGKPVSVTEEVFRAEMGQAFLPGEPASGSPLTGQVVRVQQVDSHEVLVVLVDNNNENPPNFASYRLVVEAWGNKWRPEFKYVPDKDMVVAGFTMGNADDWSLKPDRFDPAPGHPVLYIESKDFALPSTKVYNVGWWPSEYGDHCACAIKYKLVPDEPSPGEYQLQTWADPERGDVTLVPDKATYQAGEEIWLNAVYYQGWRFLTWRGEIETHDNPVKFTMPAYDCSIQAIFEAENGGGPDLEKVRVLIAGARVDLANADDKLIEAGEELKK